MPPAFVDETDLCINDHRFQVEVFWKTPAGATGQGRAVELTDDTGYFWFFNAGNVEAIVKVLDACDVRLGALTPTGSRRHPERQHRR